MWTTCCRVSRLTHHTSSLSRRARMRLVRQVREPSLITAALFWLPAVFSCPAPHALCGMRHHHHSPRLFQAHALCAVRGGHPQRALRRQGRAPRRQGRVSPTRSAPACALPHDRCFLVIYSGRACPAGSAGARARRPAQPPRTARSTRGGISESPTETRGWRGGSRRPRRRRGRTHAPTPSCGPRDSRAARAPRRST